MSQIVQVRILRPFNEHHTGDTVFMPFDERLAYLELEGFVSKLTWPEPEVPATKVSK